MKYAALINRNIYHEGDERSRTNPGHGYPAYTEEVTDWKEFSSEEEMLDWIAQQESWGHAKQKYRLVKFDYLQVNKKVEITVN